MNEPTGEELILLAIQKVQAMAMTVGLSTVILGDTDPALSQSVQEKASWIIDKLTAPYAYNQERVLDVARAILIIK